MEMLYLEENDRDRHRHARTIKIGGIGVNEVDTVADAERIVQANHTRIDIVVIGDVRGSIDELLATAKLHEVPCALFSTFDRHVGLPWLEKSSAHRRDLALELCDVLDEFWGRPKSTSAAMLPPWSQRTPPPPRFVLSDVEQWVPRRLRRQTSSSPAPVPPRTALQTTAPPSALPPPAMVIVLPSAPATPPPPATAAANPPGLPLPPPPTTIPVPLPRPPRSLSDQQGVPVPCGPAGSPAPRSPIPPLPGYTVQAATPAPATPQAPRGFRKLMTPRRQHEQMLAELAAQRQRRSA